jgi:hypothetical protein
LTQFSLFATTSGSVVVLCSGGSFSETPAGLVSQRIRARGSPPSASFRSLSEPASTGVLRKKGPASDFCFLISDFSRHSPRVACVRSRFLQSAIDNRQCGIAGVYSRSTNDMPSASWARFRSDTCGRKVRLKPQPHRPELALTTMLHEEASVVKKNILDHITNCRVSPSTSSYRQALVSLPNLSPGTSLTPLRKSRAGIRFRPSS